MIPLKLELKNFLSYGDYIETVNFEPYNLICFSGKNGHGKSALFDALTWVIWGQARKIGGACRADEALICLGQQDMSVSLDFMCNSQRYVVRRELSYYYGKSKSVLEFGIYNQEKNVVSPLTEKTVRLTQDKIEKVIGLDFDTFSSSVFLKQGHSNEFSKKSAKERKQILTTILGLEKYERVRRYVMDIVRGATDEYDGLLNMQERVKAELGCMSDVQEKIGLIEDAERELNFQEKKLSLQQKEIQESRENLFKQKERLFVLDKELACLREQLQKYKHDYELRFADKVKALEINHASVQSKRILLGERYKIQQGQCNEYDKEEKSIEEELRLIQQSINLKSKNEKKFQAARRIFEKRKELYHKMVGYGNWVSQELQNINRKDLVFIRKKDPKCPLCEQSLVRERQTFLLDKLFHQAHFYEHRVARVSTFVCQSKGILVDEHENLSAMDKELQKLVDAPDRKKELISQREKLRVARRRCLEVLQTVKTEQSALDDYSEKLQLQLNKDKSIMLLKLEQEPGYKALCVKFKEKERESRSHRNYCVEKSSILSDERVLHIELRALQKKKSEVLQEKGRLKQLMAQRKKLSDERLVYENKIAKKRDEIDEYKAIIGALGKDGIQALLIESVIPEIEHEANKLLASLSDQNAQVLIESLRDLKSGGTKETLDIKIADNAGIRSYEMFSGGEAFRIDFALRIAISTLLARRAGTALQTLIIDEGFGSQDDEGLQLVMDMLYKIQDRFAKIIIISHLSLLKNQFPVHFMVEKTASGSHVSIVEQG